MFKIIHDRTQWDYYYSMLTKKSIYCSWDYLKAAEQVEKKTYAELAIFESNDLLCFHPYIKRNIPLQPEYYDLISPYDFGGFWFNTIEKHAQKVVLSQFLDQFRIYCDKSNIVSEFIRLCPFIDLPDTSFYSLTFVENNIIIQLKKKWHEISGQYHSSLKRNLKKANSFDLCVNKNITIDDFIKLYYQNLDVLNSEPYYYFPKSFLSKISNLEIIAVEDTDGTLCAAQAYLTDNNIIYYYLGASNRNMLIKRPNDFLFNYIISDAKRRGYRILHMGGGRSESLLRFKKKFSKETVPYYIGKKIFKPDKYDDLVALQEKRMKTSLSNSIVFPLYRFK